MQSPGVAAPLVVSLHRHSPPAYNRHVHGPEPSGPQQLAQDDLVLVDSSAAGRRVAPSDGRAYVAAGVGRAEVEQRFADHVELRVLVLFDGFRTEPEAEAEYGHRQIKHIRIIIIYDHTLIYCILQKDENKNSIKVRFSFVYITLCMAFCWTV